MQKLLLILIALPMIGFGQNVNIPDANFKAYLVGNTAINTNGDTEIQVTEATAFGGGILCYNLSISDLTGIEDFTALTSLSCGDNQLTTIDVSGATALTYLECCENTLTSLDVSNNTALTTLWCPYNQLTSLDVSGATALTDLNCNYNQLTSLDVSTNIALTNLQCEFNQLTTLDLSNNTALTTLYCVDNQLTSLDVSQNTALTTLRCYSNQLTSLDVSNNTALTNLYCASNQLTSLDVRNGNNTNLNTFYTYSNPNLTCINVDDAAWSTNNWIFDIDPQHYFSTNCPPPSAIQEHTTNKELLKVTGLLGRETKGTKNEVLFYIYDDGTVEKRIIIE